MSPTYDYSGEVALKLEGITVLPTKRIETTKYYSDTNLNLVSHLPQVDPPPVKTLYNDSITAGSAQEVVVDQNYKRINVYNICGGILKFYPNNDVDNYITMPDNSFWEMDNEERNIGALYLSGESSGNVQITVDQNI